MSTGPNTLTNEIYWASRDPRIQTLQQLTNVSTNGTHPRFDRAVVLAQQGLVVDAVIDAWGTDAAQIMSLRTFYGYTWVPSILQPGVQEAPGFNLPGLTPYDPNNPPAGSIKVSTDAADYPPFEVPVEPPAVDLTLTYVGAPIYPGSNIYSGIGDTQLISDGEEINGSKGDFKATKTVYRSPFSKFGSVVVTWTKQ
jgi:hypothetical protein